MKWLSRKLNFVQNGNCPLRERLFMVRNRVPQIAAAFVIATSAVAAAGLGVAPTPAYADVTSADLQAQLDEANSHLNDLYAQAEQASEQVNQTQSDLDATNAEIAQKQDELKQAQGVLAERVSSSYKTGDVSLASIILDSNSFDDMVTRITYASKASDADAKAIQDVKDIEADLSAKQTEQQQLLVQQQAQQEELSGKVSETQDYVNSLDQQVQDKIAEERAAYEAQQAAAQQAAQQQAQTDGGYVTGNDNTPDEGSNGTSIGGSQSTNTNTNTNTSTNTNTNNGGSSNSSSGSSSSSSSTSSSGLTQTQRDAIVSAAWSKVGSSYVYGATGPNSFDCSGFTRWCYAQAGISLPRTSESQGGWGVATSNPQPGDLVCWGGHVGIYLGGGMMIDAGNPRVGVSYRAAYSGHWFRTMG